MIQLPANIQLSERTALALAAGHIGYYTEQIELCSRGVNLDECRYYLKLWQEIRTAVMRGQDLGTEHLSELFGAITDGAHDGLLSSDELLAVLGIETARAS
jgi:hypothetical protein